MTSVTEDFSDIAARLKQLESPCQQFEVTLYKPIDGTDWIPIETAYIGKPMTLSCNIDGRKLAEAVMEAYDVLSWKP